MTIHRKRSTCYRRASARALCLTRAAQLAFAIRALISSAENARNVVVRKLPREVSFSIAAASVSSSGASMTLTWSRSDQACLFPWNTNLETRASGSTIISNSVHRPYAWKSDSPVNRPFLTAMSTILVHNDE